jgi:hypothetical protein
MSTRDQPGPELLEVVDLTVVCEVDRSILVSHGLMPGRREIDDRESAVSEGAIGVVERTGVVGPAMRDCLAHSSDGLRPLGEIAHDAGEAAHTALVPHPTAYA